MIAISEDNYTHGIVKVTVFSDTYTEMMQLYKTVGQRHYNVNIYKKALRFGPTRTEAGSLYPECAGFCEHTSPQWVGFYTYTVRK
tara:strand:- start:555 stop:809 length:255 start_codon:yes stop_codon:yes gene_type:complete